MSIADPSTLNSFATIAMIAAVPLLALAAHCGALGALLRLVGRWL